MFMTSCWSKLLCSKSTKARFALLTNSTKSNRNAQSPKIAERADDEPNTCFNPSNGGSLSSSTALVTSSKAFVSLTNNAHMPKLLPKKLSRSTPCPNDFS